MKVWIWVWVWHHMMKIKILIQKLINLQMVSNSRRTQVVLRHEQGGLMILSDSVFILACRSEFSLWLDIDSLAVLGWIAYAHCMFYYSSMSLLVWLEYVMQEHMIYIFQSLSRIFSQILISTEYYGTWKLQSCVAEIDLFF